jgi:biopolymer transport protein TolQ
MILQAGSAIPHTPAELILSSSLPTKVVLVILALLSLYSWAIVLAKWIEFRRVGRRSAAFMKEFARVARIDQAASIAKRSQESPQSRVVACAVGFIHEIRPLGVDGGGADRGTLTAAQVEALHLVLDAEFTAERDRIGHYVPSLAVIGSASPLLGLFGTVMGVIYAFIGIAEKGSGNLGAVAPGVAEALTATAAALAVAVPAIFAYNVFAARLNRFDGEIEGFGAELIALLAREGRI